MHYPARHSLLRLLLCTIIASAVLGCGDPAKTTSLDTENNREPTSVAIEMLGDLEVTDVDGNRRFVKDYRSEKNLVVVFSRGYYGAVCPFCSAQVQRLASEHKRIEEAGGQVLVIFPIKTSQDAKHRNVLVSAAEFGLKDASDAADGLADAASKLPFEIVTDPELKAVDQLDIREELSKPATYILDAGGKVRYAYVGRDPGDRPRVATIVEQLNAIKG